ncbi:MULTISPECIES: response regulator [unclassified Synechocystis]|uniref:response regulator n=1 Tax=unclassified Synechocystis TaxID=2640012 RepID=UPI0004060E0D|nr:MULTISPECIES: response regulator [unclassified Synechocystis]AIE74354.1 two-component response regulator [Synechocystis sp. PCC 6714]MCT0254868.1 response regulator [Synechocystis sp. CS-94]
MQGTLNEIDPRSILRLIELGQRTGELFIEVYPHQGRGQVLLGKTGYWFLFFVDGKLVYAADQNCVKLSRLQDYLRHHDIALSLGEMELDSLALNHIPEYACLWQLLSKNILTPAQAHRLVLGMVQEVLFDVLSLRQGNFVFALGSALEPALTSFAITPLLGQMGQQIQAWKQLYLHIQSPDQQVAIAKDPALASKIPAKFAQHFRSWTDGAISLRQISRYLQKSLPAIAHGIYPYIESGAINILPSHEPHNSKDPSWETLTDHTIHKIVCLDDDYAIGKQIELFLTNQNRGCEVVVLQDPLQAMTTLLTLQPDLILCDITMPHLDGYEICRMIRHSPRLHSIPIIMLTGKDAYLDRLLARMAGATDYLTKPFTEQELISLVELYCKK